MKTFKPDLKQIFSGVQCTEARCEDCPYLASYIEEHEIWGCKERERVLECKGNHLVCQIVEQEAEDVQNFIDDNTESFNFIEIS